MALCRDFRIELVLDSRETQILQRGLRCGRAESDCVRGEFRTELGGVSG